MAMSQQSDPDARVRPGDVDDPPPRRRRLSVVPVVAVALVALSALILVQRRDLERDSSREEAIAISERFIEAHNSRDLEAVRSLVADTALISMNPAVSVDDLEMEMAWLEAIGSVITSSECRAARGPSGSGEDGVRVLCALTQENAWSAVLSREPDVRGALTFSVASDEITAVFLSFAPMSFPNEAVSTFENWLGETHPDDLSEMYVYDGLPALTPESIRLWSLYTVEFVEAQRG